MGRAIVFAPIAALFCFRARGHIHASGAKTSQFPTNALEDSSQTRAGKKHPWPAGDLGDLTCMRWTGSKCGAFGCGSGAGPVACDQGFCVCSHGHCANAEGACIAEVGEWLPGSYAVRFRLPYDRKKPYIRSIPFGPEAMNDEVGFAADADGVTAQLAAFGRGEPVWRIAVVPGGFVRFESLTTPGNVLTIYDKSEAEGVSLAETRRHRSRSRSGIGDEDDLLPVLVHYRAARARRVSFRIRESLGGSGGLDVWDPQSGLSLASADHWKRPGDGWLHADRVAEGGVAECTAPSPLGPEGDCNGREVVDFEPPLPARAIAARQLSPTKAAADSQRQARSAVMLCIVFALRGGHRRAA